MNGANLITKVRRIIDDVETPTIQGTFWKDAEILLALNSAQDVLLNYLFLLKHEHMLSGLLNTINTTSDTVTLPTDYLHYNKAYVEIDTDRWYPVKIYDADVWGGHSDLPQDSIAIVAGILYSNLDATTALRFYYYRQPTVITGGIFADSWERFVYYDLIANYATSILGIKEVQGRRDFKKYKRFLSELQGEPKEFATYFPKSEKPDIEQINQYV